jgi:soluble lytic murein transglycosylase-like protein
MNSCHLLSLTLFSATLCAAPVWAQGIQQTTENGRTIYINDESAAKPKPSAGESSQAAGQQLVYWSNTQRRWKAVPRAKSAAFRAAQSAAAEVSAFVADRERSADEQNGLLSSDSGRALVNAAAIDAAVQRAADRHNVDPNLVRAVIKVESNFNPHAVSRKGAMGLMQLMPGTARSLKVEHPFDPSENIDAGVRHLKQLLESFGGDLNRSLAAYNAGSNAVRRNNGIPPYAETQNYVRQITRLYWNGAAGQLSGGPIRNPIRVSRDADGHFVFSNID